MARKIDFLKRWIWLHLLINLYGIGFRIYLFVTMAYKFFHVLIFTYSSQFSRLISWPIFHPSSIATFQMCLLFLLSFPYKYYDSWDIHADSLTPLICCVSPFPGLHRPHVYPATWYPKHSVFCRSAPSVSLYLINCLILLCFILLWAICKRFFLIYSHTPRDFNP